MRKWLKQEIQVNRKPGVFWKKSVWIANSSFILDKILTASSATKDNSA